MKLTPFEEPIYVVKPSLPDFSEFTEIIKPIWEKQILTNNGPLHEKFRLELANYLKTDHLELFTNGHQGLEIALRLNFPKGSEIITTPFTFASTTLAIRNTGLTPVFCDVNEDDFNIDINKIEALITDKTVGIMPVHVFGLPVNVEGLEKIAAKHQLKIIYDAAHAFGVEINGKGIGAFGDISMFSLHATKVFNAVEGGVLTFNDGSVLKNSQKMKNFGLDESGDIKIVGTNAKLSELHSAMGLANLPSVSESITKRLHLIKTYRKILATNPKITFQETNIPHEANGAYFPILLESNDSRDLLFESLKEYNVFARKYFYPLTNEFTFQKNQQEFTTPIAQDISQRVLTLPLYPDLAAADVEKIAAIILKELELKRS